MSANHIALLHHLESLRPPPALDMLSVAEEAVRLADQGLYGVLLELPSGKMLTVNGLVRKYRLRRFLSEPWES